MTHATAGVAAHECKTHNGFRSFAGDITFLRKTQEEIFGNAKIPWLGGQFESVHMYTHVQMCVFVCVCHELKKKQGKKSMYDPSWKGELFPGVSARVSPSIIKDAFRKMVEAHTWRASSCSPSLECELRLS